MVPLDEDERVRIVEILRSDKDAKDSHYFHQCSELMGGLRSL